MQYIWDPKKAKTNFHKHNIDFADAVSVFEDLNAITIEDPDENEERFVTLGMDLYGRILIVVYGYQDDEMIRIISARQATKRERKNYERERNA
jgi:hypothetical protein